MKFPQKLSKLRFQLTTLDFGEYPIVELDEVRDINQQEKNIEKFQRIRRKFLISTFCFGFVFFLMFKLEKFLIDISGFVIFCAFISFIPAIYFALRYKCPNCDHFVESRSFSVSSGFSSSKGLSLFPRRCHYCGFYLSKETLNADLRKSNTDR